MSASRDHTLVGPLWDGYYEGRRCSRDTYPESYVTKYTSIRRINLIHGRNRNRLQPPTARRTWTTATLARSLRSRQPSVASVPPAPTSLSNRSYQANAHVRQSRPDFGLGFQIKLLTSLCVVSSSFGSSEGLCPISAGSLPSSQRRPHPPCCPTGQIMHM